MRCLVVLLRSFSTVLPSLEPMIPKVLKRIFKLLNRQGQSDASVELARSCCRAATIIIRDCPQYDITEKQLEVLLSFVEADLGEIKRQENGLNLLRAIVVRRLVVPKVYDLMKIVFEKAVRSQLQGVRELCQSIILKFLLDYPLTRKRLDKHMAFLASNITYQ